MAMADQLDMFAAILPVSEPKRVVPPEELTWEGLDLGTTPEELAMLRKKWGFTE